MGMTKPWSSSLWGHQKAFPQGPPSVIFQGYRMNSTAERVICAQEGDDHRRRVFGPRPTLMSGRVISKMRIAFTLSNNFFCGVNVSFRETLREEYKLNCFHRNRRCDEDPQNTYRAPGTRRSERRNTRKVLP